MVKRLVGLFFLVSALALAGGSPAFADTITLHTVPGTRSLMFNASGVKLSGVYAARLTLGSRKVGLRIRRIRTARLARTIIVVGVAANLNQHSDARLELTVPHAGQPVAASAKAVSHASSPGRVVRTSPVAREAADDHAGPVIGINVGSAIDWELQFAQTLGAKNVRMNFNINTPTSVMDPIIAAYAAAGVRPELLATFDAGTIPTASEITNLESWATRYGPHGTFWAQSGYPASLAVTRIEFGNESSGNWEYPALANLSSWWNSAGYEQVAERYGQAYVQAVSDVSGANPGVKTLAVADSPGQVPEWLQYMFQGAPTLKNVVQGWVVHPYGNAWQSDINTTLNQTEALGASAHVPVYVTEVGVSTDNGNCLDGNYGWNTCMSYAQAATTLTSQVQGIEADLGSRLAELDLYSARDINDPGTSTDMEGYFGALTSTGQTKGAYTTAIENIPRLHPELIGVRVPEPQLLMHAPPQPDRPPVPEATLVPGVNPDPGAAPQPDAGGPSAGHAITDIALQIVGRLFNGVFGVVVLVILTRALGESEFGVWSTLSTIVFLGGALTDLGFTALAVRQAAGDPDDAAGWLGSLFIVRTATSVIAAVGCALAALALNRGHMMVVAGVILSVTVLYGGVSSLSAAFQLRVRNDLTVVVMTVGSVLWTGGAIGAAVLGLHLVGFALVFSLASILTTTFGGWLALRQMHVSFAGWKPRIRTFVRVGLPLSISALLIYSYARVDQILVFRVRGIKRRGSLRDRLPSARSGDHHPAQHHDNALPTYRPRPFTRSRKPTFHRAGGVRDDVGRVARRGRRRRAVRRPPHGARVWFGLWRHRADPRGPHGRVYRDLAQLPDREFHPDLRPAALHERRLAPRARVQRRLQHHLHPPLGVPRRGGSRPPPQSCSYSSSTADG